MKKIIFAFKERTDEPGPGDRFPSEPEHPLGPLRPTTPKPPSPRSPDAASAKCPSSVSALSLSSADSEERAEGPAQREQGLGSSQEAVPAACDQGREDSGSRSHAQPSLGGASGPEDKTEEVRILGGLPSMTGACQRHPPATEMGTGGPFTFLEAPLQAVLPSGVFLLGCCFSG